MPLNRFFKIHSFKQTIMNELIELKSYKRSCELYLRALWGKGFSIQLSDSEQENSTNHSYLVDNNIFLPEEIILNHTESNYYRAAAMHASAHAIYSNYAFDDADLNLMQRSLVGLIEDLRVELLSIEQFPGLKKLWLQFHNLSEVNTGNPINLMRRLSRSVLDPDYSDEHHWVMKGKKLMQENMYQLNDQQISMTLGLSLANDIGQMRLPLNSGRYEQVIKYRDDNRSLWEQVLNTPQQADAVNDQQDSFVKKNKLKEALQGMQVELSNNDTQCGNGLYIKQNKKASFEYQQHKTENVVSTIFYPEWDYRSQVLKKGWCTLKERENVKGSVEKIEKIFYSHKNTLSRLRYIAKKLQTQKQQRVRKMQEGDDIDFDPMINAMVAMRMKQPPDTAVFIRDEYLHTKTFAISILLDLSESTNTMVTATNMSVSQMIRDAVLLLGETLSIADEKFSIAGFSSNGRHEIDFIKFKEFSETFSESKARLADIQGKHSTRLGTAIRHNAEYLAKQQASKKLLLIITDGKPSDIDVYDPDYLDHDCKHAVNSLSSLGIKPFCLNLDNRSDPVIEHIFGRSRYETLEQLIHLPDVLSRIYMRYGRH